MAAVPSIGRAAGVEPKAAGAGATQDLYERYFAQIYGFCVNRLGSREEAEDATQSTFLNAHRALRRGVTPEAELAWLFKIAHNVCLTRRRSSRRRNRVESPSDLGAVQDMLPAPPRESADDLIRLTDALSHMPDNQRRAILLREWQGLTYHEIADDLNVTQSAVETLIFRARRALAANLEVERRPRLLSRVRNAFDVGTLLAGLKALFATSAAVKATAAAVAVSGAAVVATRAPDIVSKPAPAPEPAAVVAKAPVGAAAAVDPPRVAQLERRAPAAAQPERKAIVAPKARPDKPAALRTQPPGQVRKAAVVNQPKRVAEPTRQRPVVSKAKLAPMPKAVRTEPARKPISPQAKAASNGRDIAKGESKHVGRPAANERGKPGLD
jgi:RNA polymerase sigma factor (sigma-70 family)